MRTDVLEVILASVMIFSKHFLLQCKKIVLCEDQLPAGHM